MQKLTMNQNNLASLNSITSNIPLSWNVFVGEILSRPLPWGKLPRKPNNGEIALILYRVRAWNIALHWVIKKEWNTKHKIPTKRCLAKGYESKGEFLRQILLLCERCHTLQKEVSIDIPYPNAACWFGLVFWELIISEMASAVVPEQSTSPREKRVDSPKQNPAYRKKRIQIQEETDEVMQLQSNYQNPVKGDVEGVTAIFKLFEVAIALAEKPNVFREKYLKPLLNAWKAQIKVKEDSGMGLVIREDDKVYIQLGKGRGKRILSCPKDIEKLILETFIQ